MPRTKKSSKKIIEKEDDPSLIVHLPIKFENSEEQSDNKELDKLREENKILREKLSYYVTKNNHKIILIKNKPNKQKSLKCWWCCGDCEQKYSLPDKKKNDQFYGRGNFCSFSCMVSYNFELSDDKVWHRYSLINQLKDKVNPNLNDIRPAPPKEVKKEFGGEMSDEEYSEHLDKGDDTFIKLLPPLISTEIIIEQRIKPTSNVETQMLLTEELKLKRHKPVKTSKYSLSDMIEIVQ